MMILRFLFYAFLIYLAYRLIFDFIIPVYKTTKQVRKSFSAMHERMNRHTGQHQQQKNYTGQNQNNNSGKGGEDYIDFEEIKD